MSYTVYILYSSQHQKHYTGFTSDLSTRLKSHNEFGKDWTAKYRPWKLIYCREFATKPEAIAFEKWLKTGKGRKDVKNMPGRGSAYDSAALKDP